MNSNQLYVKKLQEALDRVDFSRVRHLNRLATGCPLEWKPGFSHG